MTNGSGSDSLLQRLLGCTKKFFFIFFSANLPASTLSSVLGNCYRDKFCVKILFSKHYLNYFSPHNTFIRKEKDPDPDL
jgi:hypothetical protein